ncbi:MAG TPA: cytochrome b/b6 domain-containing protein [Planctomycetota bacterium]|nr:cytochrome b/b6 domain-containing protein [Planctomycetota bacterium]
MTRGSRLAGFVAALMLVVRTVALSAEPPLPEVTRTDQSRFVHRIALLDAKGNPIGPASEVPYSPNTTCSSSRCHSYQTVAKGTHTRMFPSAVPPKGRPDGFAWTMFEAATGMAAPLSHGYQPARAEAFDPKAHLTPFKFALQFGAWHPGGGRLELDAAGNRYDAHLAENPALRTATEPAANPDYHQARWDQSGVLENDCMACHALHGYDHVERAGQIASMNFRWAPTVGAGFGHVEGKTASLPLPGPDAKPDESAAPAIKVKYNPALFGPDGKVHLEIGKPPDANCLACHRRPAKGSAAWTDCLDADVHSKAGLKCVDCHRAGPDHVIAGDPTSTNPDFRSLTCKGCHETGRLGAPVPAHKGLPRLHLREIACETCHSGPKPQRVPPGFEQPTDPTWGVILTTRKPSGPPFYAPVYKETEAGPIGVFARMLPTYFANRREDKSLTPLDPQYIASRVRRVESEIKDDTGDGVPEVNTDAEIKAVLGALKKKDVSPVYIAGAKLYWLDDKGDVASEATELGAPLDLPLAHNVRPAPQALGAQGCTECHRADAPFFLSLGLTRVAAADGKPEGEPLYARLDRSASDVRLAGLRERYIRPYGRFAIGLVALVLVLHYVVFGPRRYDKRIPEQLVQRFSVIERLVHLTLLGSFLCLAATGILLGVGVERIFGKGVARMHDLASWALMAGALLAFLLWARDMVFSRVDIGWVKVMGGYLGYQGHVPAGRFNAGQKGFFWFILLVVACLAATGLAMRYELGGDAWEVTVYTLHLTCAYLMILCVLAHAYLGSFANPGCIGSVFNGKVARAWLEHHHPDYQPKGTQENTPHA